jgi:hypothetical protein
MHAHGVVASTWPQQESIDEAKDAIPLQGWTTPGSYILTSGDRPPSAIAIDDTTTSRAHRCFARSGAGVHAQNTNADSHYCTCPCAAARPASNFDHIVARFLGTAK